MLHNTQGLFYLLRSELKNQRPGEMSYKPFGPFQNTTTLISKQVCLLSEFGLGERAEGGEGNENKVQV